MARELTLTFLFLIIDTTIANAMEIEQRGFILDKILKEISESVLYFTKMLERFNDQYLGKSAFGSYLHYDEIKPRLTTELEESRGMKKMAMGMIPLIFHMGATSTWMVLTTILAAKSVFIGIILLVCKIAVSAAKVGSFFTSLKGHSGHGHHEWTWSPPHEHHGPVYELAHGWGESSYKSLPTEYSEHPVDKKSRISS